MPGKGRAVERAAVHRRLQGGKLLDALASGGRFQLHRYHLQPGVGIGIRAQPRRGDHQNDHKNGYIFHRFHSIEDRMLFMR